MKLTFKHSEIILISSKQSDARWVVETLKNSGFHNELIWLKDESRTLDYLKSEGLYNGKSHSDIPKIYVVDPELESLEHLKELIRKYSKDKDFQMVNIEEAKAYLKKQIAMDTKTYFTSKTSLFNMFLMTSFI